MQAIRTLGQFVADQQIVAWISRELTELHSYSLRQAKAAGKPHRLTVSCTRCTAKKTCCWSMVVARLYEGVVIADRLKRSGRDTPELRAELAARAEAMEAASPRDWRTPCVFLDARERCTIYDVRPSPCGNLHVYTDPAWCTVPAGDIRGYVPREELAAATRLEEAFRDRLSLRKKVGRRYLGVLPRMVLVALEAWDRSDFREYLRQLPWPGEAELARWSRATPASAPTIDPPGPPVPTSAPVGDGAE
ncbi:MAG TPA: YkgJ family cysteine cluster protein [Kofleriaceae bacterium]|nr:YkgJ family cysteine cluster protein [Kofleriaceae bacterium]